jgi:MshEN domain
MNYRYLGTTGVLNEAGSRVALWEGPVGLSPGPRSRPAPKLPQWRGTAIPRAVCALVPESLARGDLVFPISLQGETLTLAAVDHDSIALKDKLSFTLARKVRFVPAPREEILSLINESYGPYSPAVGAMPVDAMYQEFSPHEGPRSLAFRAPEPSARGTRPPSGAHGGQVRPFAPAMPARISELGSIQLPRWEAQACGFTSLRKASACWRVIPTARRT